MSPQQQLIKEFLSLPATDQLRIGQDMGLIPDGIPVDHEATITQMFVRVQKGGQWSDLWTRVMGAQEKAAVKS